LDEVFTPAAGDWTRRTLASLGTIITGSTPKTSEPENFGDDVPFITPGDFRADGSLDTSNRGLSEQGAAKTRLISGGSALMVCIGASIGKAGHSTVEVAANQQINAISPNDDVSGEFLYFQFLTPRFQNELKKMAAQATLPIISKAKWSELEVCVPPSLSTQVQVAAEIRAVSAHTSQLQARYSEKLADIVTLRKSLLQAAFSGHLT
jgi:type I restriction enzyme S subunit